MGEQRTEPVSVQVILIFKIMGRTGLFVAAQLLTGTIEENMQPIEMVSVEAGDRWHVSLKEWQIFGPPGADEKRRQLWEQGERTLWFIPMDEMRPILEAEIFQTLAPKSE